MKKLTALIMALLMLSLIFAGCAKKTETASGGQTSGTAETPDEEPTYRTFDTPYQEALVTYAEAMLARRTFVQYDDSRLVPGTDPAIYRWQRQTMAAEDYTSQLIGYTNCAAFTHDIYYFALGFDIRYWSTYMLINASADEKMFYYAVTGAETAEEKETIKKQFLDTLQTGDIVVYRHSADQNGHALFYAGENRIIHSTAPSGGSYDYGVKSELLEPSGSIQTMSTSEFFNENNSRYFFGGTVTRFAIVRPLNIFNGEVPESSQNRAKNLQGVMVQKLCSKTIGQSVEPGEELTYSFSIKNNNKWKVTLDVRDTVPEHTSYVSGGDSVNGSDISWTVTVPKGETVTIEYKVKVDSDPSLLNGGYIYNDKATVGGVPCKTPAIYVGKHLTDDEKTKINDAITANATASGTGFEIAAKIYSTVGMDIKAALTSPQAIIGSLYTASPIVGYYNYNTDSPYFANVPATMYGGRTVLNSPAYNYVRTRSPYIRQLEVGDIIFCTDNLSDDPADSTFKILIIGEKNSVLRIYNGSTKLLTSTDAQNELFSIIGFRKFAVIRPALTMK